MKTCRKCQVEKHIHLFRKDKYKKDGFDTICNDCYNSGRRASGCNRKQSLQYRNTPKGRAIRCWNKIQSRANNKDGRNPSYSDIQLKMTKEEFLSWAIPQYEEWAKHHPEETPSINRIDPYGHYELSNIQIISLKDNIIYPKRKHSAHIIQLKKKKIIDFVLDKCRKYGIEPKSIADNLQ